MDELKKADAIALERYDTLYKYVLSNSLTTEKKRWQPLVFPVAKWRNSDLYDEVKWLKHFPHLNLNMAFEFMNIKNYLKDERYALGLFSKIRDIEPLTKILLLFPPNYVVESLDDQLTRQMNTVEPQAANLNQWMNIFHDEMGLIWPHCYMKFIPYGSHFTDLTYLKTPLNICIELDEPDLQFYTENKDANIKSDMYPSSYPEVLAKIVERFGKVTQDPHTGFLRFYIDSAFYEINFNKEITTETTQLTNLYLNLDPRVKPFLLALKVLGKSKCLLTPHVPSGIRFYAYTVMALAYLSQLDPPVIPNLQCITENNSDDDCGVEDCRTKYKYWDTVPGTHGQVGIGARYHNCVEYTSRPIASKYNPQPDAKVGKNVWHSSNEAGVGELFLDFLHYYGYRFDFTKYAVSLKFGGRTHKKENWSKHGIAIEDPFMTHVNLGQSVMTDVKFVKVFRGCFTVLQSGIVFLHMAKRIADITSFDSLQGKNNDRVEYVPLTSWLRPVTSKSFLLIGLPKKDQQDCYCERIVKLFSTHGTITKTYHLDSTTMQIFFDADTGNARTIALPSSFTLDGETVFLLELFEYATESNAA